MALDNTGLSIPTLQELKNSLATSLQTNLGVAIDTTEKATAGIINAIYAAALSNAYELIQATYTQRTLDGAEGINLDDLVSYTNIYRLSASESFTNKAHFIGDEGTNLPQGAVVENPATADQFETPTSTTITTLSAYRVVYSVASVLNNTQYPVTINGVVTTYTSDANATEEEILSGIEAVYSGSAGYTVEKVGATLEITSGFIDVPISVTATTFLSVDEVTSIGSLVCKKVGAISAPTGSLTKIISPVAGWTGVNNPEQVILGRDRETDEELRERQQDSLAVAQTGTSDAITTRLRGLSGVTAAFVAENDTNSFDIDFRPPKSYEAVVSGGNDLSIAQTLWDSKPAGIELVGTETSQATDIDGNIRSIKFSRPLPVFVHVQVTYTLYDEESFPAEGEDLIRAAILNVASDLDIGEDVIPKRFYGAIYSAVSGIENLVVGMTKTVNEGDTPSSYTEDSIAVGLKEVANFTLDRVVVISP